MNLSAQRASSAPPSPRNIRAVLVSIALLLFAIATAARYLAENELSGTSEIDLALLRLQLSENSGVAFGLGADAPSGVVLGATLLMTVCIGAFCWRHVTEFSLSQRIGIAAVLAGAVSNVVDRLDDASVTDYLHTGWFPTFNLPDVLITCGAILLVAGQRSAKPRSTKPAN